MTITERLELIRDGRSSGFDGLDMRAFAGEVLLALSEETKRTAAENKLLLWAAKMIEAHRNDGYPGDVDGGWLQDTLAECGVLVEVPVTEPCDPDICVCAEQGAIPGSCYRMEAMVRHVFLKLLEAK